MEYRILGRTGLKVGAIALGCEGFADKTAEEVRADFDFAIRNGINKVNVGTVILHSYLDTLKATLGNLEKAQYNEGVFEDAVEAVSQAAAVWIRKTMSDHRV